MENDDLFSFFAAAIHWMAHFCVGKKAEKWKMPIKSGHTFDSNCDLNVSLSLSSGENCKLKQQQHAHLALPLSLSSPSLPLT